MTYQQVIRSGDAGLYREWLTETYGPILAYGGCPATYSRAVRHARSLAKMVDANPEDVIADVIADVEGDE